MIQTPYSFLSHEEYAALLEMKPEGRTDFDIESSQRIRSLLDSAGDCEDYDDPRRPCKE